MIKSYMASPKRFKQVDFDMIGSGTGVHRYALGIYMGEKPTAMKYYNDYQNFSDADQKYYLDGKEIPEGSPGHEVADYLIQNRQDVAGAQEHFKSNPAMTKALKLLTDDFTKIDFETEYAALYEAKLPHYDTSELLQWDKLAGEERIIEIGYALLNSKIDIEDINEDLQSKIEELDINENYDTVEGLMDSLYNAAYESADEQDIFPGYTDKDELKEVWDQYATGETNSSHNLEHDFYNYIEQKYIHVLDKLKSMTVSVQFNNEMTNGDVYCHLSSVLNPECENIEKNNLGKKRASEFLAKEFSVVGYVADTMFGRDNAQEIIITDEMVANSIKLTEIDLRNDHDDDYDYDNEDSMSY